MSDVNKKKSAADKKLDASLKGLSARQRSEAAAQQREQRKWKLYGLIAIIVAVLIAALLFWDSGFIQKRSTAISIGERDYTVADMDYYYYSQYNTMQTYASYYGIDTSVSLKDQEAYDGTSWYDYILDNAKSSLTTVSVLAQEAEAEGYTISEDGQKNIDDAMQDLEEVCEENKITKAYYLRQMFGRFMTLDRYEKIINEYFYAYDYQDHKTDSFEVTDSQLDDYYEENKDTLDTYDYLCYMVNADPEPKQDEDGEEITPTDEDKEAAATAAKELADQMEAALKEDDMDAFQALVEENNCEDYSDTPASSFSGFSFGSWLSDGKRSAGDTTVVEYTTGSDDDQQLEGYYVVKFNRRYRDDYEAPSLRNILIQAEEDEEDVDAEETTYLYDDAKAKAEEVQQTWLDNGGTEDAFAELTQDNSDDSATSYNGGLRNSVAKGTLDEAVEAWLYDESRKSGDYTILKDESNTGYQLLYFVGWDDLYYWQSTAKSSLQAEAYSDWYDETAENYEDTTTWFYSQVG